VNKALFVLGLAVLPFATGPTAAPHAFASKLDGTSWILSTLTGRTPTGHSRITLTFHAGRISGTDGCNQYSGPYSAADTRLGIGPEVVSTQMGCPAEIMRLASSYMSVLLAANAYRISDGELLLVGTAGAVLATFVAPTKPLADSHW
jgi:heat shock protein HslJ